jgi:PIN domain nuclease of toxin-antitoxin system
MMLRSAGKVALWPSPRAPLTGNIALLAVELEGLHADPADRFIAATAIAHRATLITADARLLAWQNEARRQNAEA